MTPTRSPVDGPVRATQRAAQPQPEAAASPSPQAGDDAPSTPEEAARKFETVLVRQFTKVMTENMFSNSMAGEGGGKWMESQRDRQRKHVTDMITEQLVESNTLGISEKLMQKWGATDGEPKDATDGEREPADPAQETLDVPSDVPAAPAAPDPRPRDPLPTPPNESHIDHAA